MLSAVTTDEHTVPQGLYFPAELDAVITCLYVSTTAQGVPVLVLESVTGPTLDCLAPAIP